MLLRLFFSLMLFFFSIYTQDSQTETQLFTYDLHNFKSFWRGSGSAVQYPGRILLTSDKLRYQQGSVTTMEKFDLGENYSTEITFDYHITDTLVTNQNVIFTLSENIAQIEKITSDSESYLPLPSTFQGFVLYIRNFETAHTGWFNSGKVSKEEILSRGKVCKLAARKKNQIRVLLKYNNKTMNVYFEDNKDGSLRLCGQFTQLVLPQEQFIMASASDDVGFSQISISKWTITTNTKLEIVPVDQKKLGDSFFAYWDASQMQNPSAEISNFKATALYYYDNSKVYSEELIQLADKNLEDLKREFAGEITVTSERMQQAIQIIGREADQLEALGWILTQSKNKHKYNTIEILDMTLNWLESIEESVDKTDAETQVIYDLVSKLNVESAASEMLFKAENLISNLKKLNFKATYLSKEESLKFLEDETVLKDWKDSLKDFQNVVKEKIKETQSKNRGGASNYGMSIAWLAGILVLCGFIWIYLRLKNALDKSSSSSF